MKVNGSITSLLWLALIPVFVSCSDSDEPFDDTQSLEKNEEFGAGPATVFDESENAFGQLSPNLDPAYNRQFVVGNSIFRRSWVTAPSSTEDLDGLGPLFNARSCGACHFKDGRGAPPLTPAEEPVALLFRFSKPGPVEWEQLPDSQYGHQFNPNAILGLLSEGSVSVSYQEVSGRYADGTPYRLRDPLYTFTTLNHGALDPDTEVSPRIAPHLVGLGLLEAIPEETLLQWADESDADGDGISGRPNYVLDVATGQRVIGRFGWKANQPSVRQQIASAFVGDIGITSSLFPDERCGDTQADCQENVYSEEVELREDILDRITLYSSTLAVPKRRDWDRVEVLRGKTLFDQLQCSGCHQPKVTTGTYPDIPEYENQRIRPYTDLLLHDMGEGLADHAPDGYANGQEWRTPPLWGIGMFPVVNGHTFYLHDGRARTLEEAVLWHGGEAQNSKEAFTQLHEAERQALIYFLESL